jgi:hypothetical protein
MTTTPAPDNDHHSPIVDCSTLSLITTGGIDASLLQQPTTAACDVLTGSPDDDLCLQIRMLSTALDTAATAHPNLWTLTAIACPLLHAQIVHLTRQLGLNIPAPVDSYVLWEAASEVLDEYVDATERSGADRRVRSALNLFAAVSWYESGHARAGISGPPLASYLLDIKQVAELVIAVHNTLAGYAAVVSYQVQESDDLITAIARYLAGQ